MQPLIRRFGIGLAVGILGFISSCAPSPAPSALPVVTPPPEERLAQDLHYQTYDLPQGMVHTLLIPHQGQFRVRPALVPEVQTVAEFSHQAGNTNAIAVLNGGFFDPANQKSTSFVIQQGQVVADPRDNERLINNPNLQAYLPQIFDRSEFRRYQCGDRNHYEIAPRRQAPPSGCQLLEALGGGPQLLPQLTAVEEGFFAEVNGTVIRDPIGKDQPNARTAIGITQTGDILWVMVAQRPDLASGSGMSLPGLAEFMRSRGVVQALNLDGGSSSSLYYQGKTVYGKVDEAGNPVIRPVKSALIVEVVR